MGCREVVVRSVQLQNADSGVFVRGRIRRRERVYDSGVVRDRSIAGSASPLVGASAAAGASLSTIASCVTGASPGPASDVVTEAQVPGSPAPLKTPHLRPLAQSLAANAHQRVALLDSRRQLPSIPARRQSESCSQWRGCRSATQLVQQTRTIARARMQRFRRLQPKVACSSPKNHIALRACG